MGKPTQPKAATEPKYWLVKTEPESFSIDDLAALPRQTTFWSGVRNYQARNFMRDQMQQGDRVLFYHSNASPSAVVGVAKVVRTGYPDHTSWDEADHHYDPASTPANPRWYMVDLKLERKFPRPLSLAELRGLPRLKKMELLRTGSRLSVQPVSPDEFEAILEYSAQPQGGTAPRP